MAEDRLASVGFRVVAFPPKPPLEKVTFRQMRDLLVTLDESDERLNSNVTVLIRSCQEYFAADLAVNLEDDVLDKDHLVFEVD